MVQLRFLQDSLWQQTQDQPVTFFKEIPNAIAFGGKKAIFAMVFRLLNSSEKDFTSDLRNGENSPSIWKEVHMGLNVFGILQVPISHRMSLKKLWQYIQRHVNDIKAFKTISPASREEILHLFGLAG
ncbi:MAG: hypothetical protein ACFFC7_14175 [Candidatus Hermodarchaeota archaeon]